MDDNINFSTASFSSPDFTTILAGAFQINPPSDNMLIPAVKGRGILQRWQIDTEIFFLCWQFTLNKKLIVHKTAMPPDTENNAITLLYVLQGDISAGEQIKGSSYRVKHDKTILVLANNSDFQFEIPAESTVKTICISIGTNWLKKELANSGKFYEQYFTTLYKKASAGPLLFNCTIEELQLLNDLEKYISNAERNLLPLKAQAFLLISSFFLRFTQGIAPGMENQKVLYYDQVMVVEKILHAHLEKKLPELPVIAKQLAISVSTLKRHFKKFFGKNIYEHYLDLKMNYARKLLEGQLLSVKEVAIRLQYENVSGFIEMFKRHHGVSPGSLIKPLGKQPHEL
ncbi:MAG: AraC family transcriptional regulator [Chitinophagaceae bacterium]